VGVEALEARTQPGFVAPLNFDNGGGPVAVGDFNGDGIPDLAVANSGSFNVSVLLGTGDGSFQAARNFAAGLNPYSVAVGDFNGDGWADLAVAASYSNDVSILLNDGTWPSAPGGGSSPPAGPRGLIGPALAGVLPPRPDPLPLPASPDRGTVATLPPAVAAVYHRLPETQADGFAGVILRPMLARSPAAALHFLDSEVLWAEWPEWVA
jgi:hypothetical protein